MCATYENAKEHRVEIRQLFSELVNDRMVGVGLEPDGDEGWRVIVSLSRFPPDDVALPSEFDGVPVGWRVISSARAH